MIGFSTALVSSGLGYASGLVVVDTNLTAALLTHFFLYGFQMLSLEHVDLMCGERLNACHS